jgi:hypothetical protein
LVTAIRCVNIILALVCIGAFAPALVHARDNVDRVYLVGGALLLMSLAIGSATNLHAPFRPSILLAIAAELTLLKSAQLSRRRRLSGGGRA